MKNANQRTQTLAVAMLLVIVTGVLAFGRRTKPHTTVDKTDPPSEIMLRHPFALNVDGQPSASGLGPEWPHARAQAAIGSQPLAPIPAQRRLIALPPTDLAADQNPPNALMPRSAFAAKTHRIVEGDSLELLAEQYLGSRDRSLELFEANRHVLIQPDLLPLGKRILIPSQPSPPVLRKPTSRATDLRPLVPLN